ncbi:hypothetical protein HD806DRAFT_541276 [Xylariaceae sp. AK1471]|nr:hypothetical protein HD806DRAFT_541276 [Xylariaceae sp. AK1471]
MSSLRTCGISSLHATRDVDFLTRHIYCHNLRFFLGSPNVAPNNTSNGTRDDGPNDGPSERPNDRSNDTMYDNLYHHLVLAVGAFFFTAIFLSVFGPVSVRPQYGEQVLQSTPNLVGFEGVMLITKLERPIFGFNSGRLNYEASSILMGANRRVHDLRIDKGPD